MSAGLFNFFICVIRVNKVLWNTYIEEFYSSTIDIILSMLALFVLNLVLVLLWEDHVPMGTEM